MRLTAHLAAALAFAIPATAAAQEDANIDRAFLTSTAENQPKGSLAVSAYQFFLTPMLGASYALTNEVQLSGAVSLPMFDEDPSIMTTLSAKARFIRSGRFRVAAQGMATRFSVNAFGEGVMSIYSLGGIASVCLYDACGSLLSVNVNRLFVDDPDDTSLVDFPDDAVTISASLVQEIHPNTKLLFEVIGAAGKDESGWNTSDGALVNYGLRIHSRSWSGDFGFMMPVTSEGGVGFPLGLPFANLTYRTL